jgi:hypothetical protein
MDLVNGDLGVIATVAPSVGSDTVVHYYNPTNGDFIRAVTYSQSNGGSSEAMAFDGTTLWLLANSIDGYDPNGGIPVRVMTNPARGCEFEGTGMGWEQATNSLMVACTSGNWYRISIATGMVTASGNNGQGMFGLKATNC